MASTEQFTIGMDALEVREPPPGSRCQYRDGSVAAARFTGGWQGQTPPSGFDRSGRCTRDADVWVDSGTTLIKSCRRHARPEWLEAAGVD